MVKNVFLMIIGLSMITMSYGQISETKVVGNAEDLKSISTLNELAHKVNTAYTVYQQSATSSRSSSVAAKTDYEAALTVYLRELETQIVQENNATHYKSIQAEIDLVKKLQTNLISTSTK